LPDLPHLETKGGGLQGIVQTGEEADFMGDFLAKIPPLSPKQRDRLLSNFTLNASALSMSQEREHLKYRWTHCFILPQAAWSLAPMLPEQVQLPQVTCS
jgi:hypothetical protein